MRKAVIVGSIGTLLVAAACSSSEGPGTGTPLAADSGTNAKVTFHKDVEPILQKSCQGCHVTGGIGPFPLVTYSNARLVGDLMAEQTAARAMPPWHSETTSECTPPYGWRDDLRLSDTEIVTLAKWRDDGKLEGDPKDAPAPRTLSAGLPNFDRELKPATAYTLPPSKDQFRCFVLDPELAAESYLNGVFVVPGNASIVHHALLFTDPKGTSKTLADASMSYDCFGGVRVDDSELLAAWAPGGVPLEYPPHVAVPVPAHSLMVMQVHYHPHSATDSDTDTTTVQLRFNAAPPEYRALSVLIGNFRGPLGGGDGLLPGPGDPASGPAFVIPAGSAAHVESMRFTFTADRLKGITPRLYGVGAHMHLVGVDEKISLTYADGSSQCLLQEPRWDFDWQRRYDYDAALTDLPTVPNDSRLDIRCTYDNTPANPKLVSMLTQQNLTQPGDVELGETTLDEMCLAAITVIYPAP